MPPEQKKSNLSKGKQKNTLIPPIRPHTKKTTTPIPKGKRTQKTSKSTEENDDHRRESETVMPDIINLDSSDDSAMDDEGGYRLGDNINMNNEADEEEGYLDIDNGDDITSRREENYTVLGEDDIRRRQEEDILEVSSVLSISTFQASILLRHYNWSISNLHDAWFADEEKVRMTVGLLEKPVIQYPNAKKLTCGICFDNYSRNQMHAAACGHLFCSSCWDSYISTSINDGTGCLMLRCPDPSCGAAVGQEMINILVSDEAKEKYAHYLLRSYVEASRKSKWCPAPGCGYAVDFVLGSGSYDVTCKCTHSFCWNCTEEVHRPVECDIVAKWILKNTAESENTTWILANSKPCPKCKRPIEKRDGCMHMTCTPPCRFHFCWLCLGAWSEHGTGTGGFYSCNRYEKAKKDGEYDETEKRREMAKRSLERYTHYYERWATNEKSRVKAMQDLQEMQAVHIEKLSNDYCQLESQLKFITEAWRQIIECRRVLKWTYAYGYYLPEHEKTKRQFFEYLQGDAEAGLERLHQCAEKDLKSFIDGKSKDFNAFRTKLSGLTTVTKNFFENLVRALENGLADVDSVGACSKSCNSKASVAVKKKKSGRGKGATSRSSVVGRGQEDQAPALPHTRHGQQQQQLIPPPPPPPPPQPQQQLLPPQPQQQLPPPPQQQQQPPPPPPPQQQQGSWSCDHCTYFNEESPTICQMCSQHRGSWSCGICTYFNTAFATICHICNQQR
ncbi:hypothetical protein AQUCO_00900141v1 [Aquilegia coerulea]|uniref:RBR-type E3 ubiquitin transferase n=1 Tax=Aquilegia coerulea TaxID=218851 RepID=A0A2G5EC64_AQUCA|nr:hypothetical protein AQUCO_00900141v1 [Aquilegia coerulea]